MHGWRGSDSAAGVLWAIFFVPQPFFKLTRGFTFVCVHFCLVCLHVFDIQMSLAVFLYGMLVLKWQFSPNVIVLLWAARSVLANNSWALWGIRNNIVELVPCMSLSELYKPHPFGPGNIFDGIQFCGKPVSSIGTFCFQSSPNLVHNTPEQMSFKKCMRSYVGL